MPSFPDINSQRKPELVSLMDLVFILLIFFIVITVSASIYVSHESEKPSRKAEAGNVPRTSPRENLPIASAGEAEQIVDGLLLRFKTNGEDALSLYLHYAAGEDSLTISDLEEEEERLNSLSLHNPGTLEPATLEELAAIGPFAIDRNSDTLREDIRQKITERIQEQKGPLKEDILLEIRAPEFVKFGLVADIFAICKAEGTRVKNISFWVSKRL